LIYIVLHIFSAECTSGLNGWLDTLQVLVPANHSPMKSIQPHQPCFTPGIRCLDAATSGGWMQFPLAKMTHSCALIPQR